jgi:ribosomal protein L3 glutamine methyltransferase
MNPPQELETLRDWLRWAVTRFGEARLAFGHGTTNAYDEAAYLLLHGLHLPLDQLEPFLDARLTMGERNQLAQLFGRRIDERVPAAYITHEAWLGEFRFYVDERVIVPRSFIAELLPEGIDPWLIDPDAVHRILDLCTGSGCLAILAALAYLDAEVDAADISADALDVARRNVAAYLLEGRVHPVESDLFAALPGRRYDLILSNPPYVDAASMRSLPDEYRKEPALALAAGVDGLDIVRRILGGARRHLAPKGVLVVEIGHNRDVLEAAFPALEFTWLEVAAGDGFVFLLTREQLDGAEKTAHPARH